VFSCVTFQGVQIINSHWSVNLVSWGCRVWSGVIIVCFSYVSGCLAPVCLSPKHQCGPGSALCPLPVLVPQAHKNATRVFGFLTAYVAATCGGMHGAKSAAKWLAWRVPRYDRTPTICMYMPADMPLGVDFENASSWKKP
jgi:hypothetical protein